MTLIPVYAQYYDENNNIITKEVTHQDSPNLMEREVGIPVTVTSGGSVSIKYYNSNIKYARALAERWAKRKNINVFFNTFIFTTDAKPEWWSIQPKESSYTNGLYEPQFISMYKNQGIGIIIRDIKLPSIVNTSTKKNFTEEMIPF
jgi:hypothetical protein